MAFTKEQKKEILEELKEKISHQKMMIFADFKGLKNKDISEFKKELRKSDSELKIAKKTLLKIALKEKEIEIPDLEGQISVIFSPKDEIASTKTVYNFAKNNENLKILGGFFENDFIDREKIIQLGQIPGKQELLASLVGSLKNPISSFVYTLEANLKGLIYTLSVIKK